MEPSESDCSHHADMVYELGQAIPSSSSEMQSILNQCTERQYLTKAEAASSNTMEDLCSCLMKNEVISHGMYKKLKDIPPLKRNAGAIRIIDRCANKIAKITGEENSHQFRKQVDNTHDARILDVWLRARESIGHIQGRKGGTGFRVGEDYIMTAYHVAAGLAKEHDSDDEDWSLLDAEDVFIEFKFPKQYVGEKFQLQPELIQGDEKLDYAILKLKPRETHQLQIPKPFTRFKKIYDEQFSLFGFPEKPDDKIMQFDSDIVLFNLYADDNASRRGYMMEDNGNVKRGYAGIGDEGKVLFDCWVQHGASGAPGIVVGKDFEEPVCTLMLLCGFPVHAFQGVNVPKNEMIEQGITMEHIAKDIGRRNGKELKRKIFGDCFH
ncbi:uncharacterized protein [Argopecten irradians]|uniref:uncharacterized protein isoform X2 n=1 Tax=Argopecten irradians TaxID=31199 RepID=UPI00371AD304